MIQIITKTKISLEQATDFAIEQKAKGIHISKFTEDDCKWLMKVVKPIWYDCFKAMVRWYQLEEYETGDTENPIGTKETLMFTENFSITKSETQAIWSAIGGNISSTDDVVDELVNFIGV